MIDAAAIQNALHSWLSSSTALPCVWERQNGLTQRPASYCTMDLSGLLPVGGHAASHDFDEDRPAGEEVEFTADQPGECTLRVQAFSELAAGETGDKAVSLLSASVARLRLPTVRATLEAAGVGVLGVGPVSNLTGLAGTKWQGRAAVEVRLSVVESVSERVGYIETVETSTTLTR